MVEVRYKVPYQPGIEPGTCGKKLMKKNLHYTKDLLSARIHVIYECLPHSLRTQYLV